jgi:hypothetical protein
MSFDLLAPSADVPPATSSDLKLSPFASTFRDPVIDIPQPLPTVLIPSSTFIGVRPSLFCFLDASIHLIPSIDSSTMINSLRAPPMYSPMFVDIVRPHSAFQSAPFLNKMFANQVSVPRVAVNFLNVLFLAMD